MAFKYFQMVTFASKFVQKNNKTYNTANVFLQLKDWLDLSLNAHVPPSLLLLSRTLYLPETIDPVTKLGMSISALPEAAALRASAEIGIKEGKTRNVAKLEVIKEEQRKIEEEAAETLKQVNTLKNPRMLGKCEKVKNICRFRSNPIF